MTLSFPNIATVKQYAPGLYFIIVSAWVGVENQNLWMVLIALAFIIQMTLNNRYINLGLGVIMIAWSAYIALSIFLKGESSLNLGAMALSFTIVNLYMSRMLFLNQNFTTASLRENSLDEILFL